MSRSPKSYPSDRAEVAEVLIPPIGLVGSLRIPQQSRGIIAFAHGSGSSRFSPRNTYVAEALNHAGFATLLFDLLTKDEEADRSNVFDIPLLAERLTMTLNWTFADPRTDKLPVGLFGASTGAAAALVSAAALGDRIGAVVSRGGRPDMAAAALEEVRAPTLLIVGGNDQDVLALNRSALARLTCPKELKVIPGASHLFSESGALDAVVAEASAWFTRHLSPAARHAREG
ncbi:hydrolase [Mesorhizobium sp. Root102]|uniref:dienelactone hydrolase family protein n=1 Tax=Mesorhizobium sp. Root102 TaxID=1736422 RepID=UPI0006F8E2CA|nr:dienelactone hydrolase family protein [Mesorhizobium sp. Root102]KQU92415.1 hydrolase [Mesorhizobium sp. Root102]